MALRGKENERDVASEDASIPLLSKTQEDVRVRKRIAG
jgi:hypothetical protein